ncbi:NUDIX hydrolase [Yinghuangia aomiensis]
MPITNEHIRATVDTYLDIHPGERRSLALVLELLEQGADLASRKEFRGHVTAGAILIGADGRLLQIRHVALDKWLFPGGHVEAEDSTLADAALRELAEETGIDGAHVTLGGELPAHIDVHPIPANISKNEPDHWHIDFRFLFRTTSDIGSLQTEEVDDSCWRSRGAVSDGELRAHIEAALKLTTA